MSDKICFTMMAAIVADNNESSSDNVASDGYPVELEQSMSDNDKKESSEVSMQAETTVAFPDELLLEEVDMNDEDMDVLEWTVRKIIPIPKKYYWEDPPNPNLPLRTKAWHKTVGALGSVVRFTDRVGKPIVESVERSSRFEYVTDHMTEEDWEAAKQTAEERRARREQKAVSQKQRETEEGTV